MTLDLEPIKERLAAATPGPWEMSYDADDKWTSITGQPYDDGGQWLVCPEVATCEGEPDADSTFIAHAPEDMRALIEEVETLRGQVEAVRAAVANHPAPCEKHPDGDTVTCGWKSAYQDVVRALEAA